VRDSATLDASDKNAAFTLTPFFEPKVVAVIGANRSRGQIGSEILHNLIATGFTGTVIPVHPAAREVQGLAAYARVTDIPLVVDLAIVVVPAACVAEAVDDCLVKGVSAICIISAGFGESGAEGRAREAAIVERIRAAGCRLIGPNCMGLLNTDPRFRLNATFSPVYPPPGTVAMSTQSGALGLAILDYAKQLNIGISSFVSVGNKADVSGNDLLEYWDADPRTSVILLYLESFGNPAKFSRLARQISRRKPIVALKSGRSTVGARAAASHTGALASSDRFVDALFHQSGVVRTDTVTELFDVATLLAHQPLPRGRRVAILTNAGGPGILAADACLSHGLAVPELLEPTKTRLRDFLPPAASLNNPVDMLASAPPDHYARALECLLEDDAIDSVLVIFIPPIVTDADLVAAAIANTTSRGPAKPVAGVFMRSAAAPAALSSVPCYPFPEAAAIAMARVAAYGEWRAAPSGIVPVFDDVDRPRARAVIEGALAHGGGWLSPVDAIDLIASVGVRTPASQLASSIDEAVAGAVRLRFPVVLKAVGRELLHKTEHDAIRLGLGDAEAVRAAATELTRTLGGRMEGLLVQEMIGNGVEMIVGALNDRTFGQVVVCGSGGILVDLLADSACALCPVSDRDAADMVNSLKGTRLLRGFRGRPAADEAALRETILRISTLVGFCPEIQELDLNPLTVLTSGVRALDVRVRVTEAQSASPSAARS
jgi:acetate---CoA ligase (ADP-forming)